MRDNSSHFCLVQGLCWQSSNDADSICTVWYIELCIVAICICIGAWVDITLPLEASKESH